MDFETFYYAVLKQIQTYEPSVELSQQKVIPLYSRVQGSDRTPSEIENIIAAFAFGYSLGKISLVSEIVRKRRDRSAPPIF